MSFLNDSPQSADNPPTADSTDDASQEEAEFGIIDVIEAFTAMRHEWKSQTRETRALAESVTSAAERIDAYSRQATAATAGGDHDSTARNLAEIIAEVDLTVDRAVAAALQFRGDDGTAEAHANVARDQLHERFIRKSWLGRWMARAWHREVCQWLDEHADTGTTTDTVFKGLQLMQQRVQRLMQDCGIQRIDVTGLPFDANEMNAIEAVEVDDVPSGQVVEQIRPAYRWQGTRIKYADVRIAR